MGTSNAQSSSTVGTGGDELTHRDGVRAHYENAFKQYDDGRRAIGSEQVIARLHSLGDLSSLRVFEGGVGTGLYTAALHRAGIGALYGLELSMQGLETALRRLEAANTVVLRQGDVTRLPYANGGFDAACYFFVSHHLDSPGSHRRDQWPQLELALTEAHRVVRPGGLLILGTCTREQIRPETSGYWYSKYFPDGAIASASRFVDTTRLQEILSTSGFSGVEVEPIKEVVYTPDAFDPRGPFDAGWRSRDSLFKFYTDHPDDLRISLAQLERDIASGAVEREIESARHRAEIVKHGVLVVARR